MDYTTCMPKKDTPSLEDKLDVIIHYMHKMDRRDRLRTWGGFLRGVLGLIPIAAVVWSVWYFYEHGDEMLMKITTMATQQAAQVAEERSGDMLQQLQLLFPSGTQ